MQTSVRCIARLLCLAVICTLLGGVFCYASGGARRKVRVGYYQLSNFQEGGISSSDGSVSDYRGYSYDYLLAVAQYAAWDYDFVPVTYDDGIRMLENGELDLMNNVEKSIDYADKLAYSDIPSGDSCTCLIVHLDNTSVAYEDFEAFDSLSVGLLYGSSRNSKFVDYCKDNDCLPRLVYYRTADELEKAYSSGAVDARIVSSLDDASGRTVAKFATSSYYFAVPRGSSDLLRELNSAMNSLKTDDPYFEEKIYSKYHVRSAQQNTVVSRGERGFISSGAVVRVSYDPSWYPLSYTENGKFCGALAQLFTEIASRTGLSFEFVSEPTFAAALDDFTSGKTQLFAGFPYDYTWADRCGAQITHPFATLTVFAACRKSDMTSSAASDTLRAAVTGDSYQEYLSSVIRGDKNTFVHYDSTDICLEAVMNHVADFAFLDSYQMEYYNERSHYRNLVYKIVPGAEYRLSLAVSDSADPYLYSIAEKALDSIGSDEINNLLKSASLTSGTSRSLIDILYANPQAAVIFFASVSVLTALLFSVMAYLGVIRKKNLQLQAALNSRSEFLSSISHDMRTPLNGILGYTKLASSADTPEKTADYLEKIRISGEFMRALINDTLDISRIESGKYELTPENFDAAELVDSIVVPIRASSDAKGVKLSVDLTRMRGGTVCSDRMSLQKIILNLLSNAVKFTPQGGTVSLSVADPVSAEELRAAQVSAEDCNCRITVEDNGIGMSEDFLPEMFEPYAQEHSPESRGSTGTGLGLAIVHRVVTLMGGEIKVRSEKGRGTRFDVYLPVKHAAAPAAPVSSAPGNPEALRGRRILLCEDNAMNSEIAVTLLEQRGVETETAENGQAGVDRFAASAEGEFDAVLMDLRMPVMDGYTAARRIRALDRSDAASVPIIAMSADAYDDDIRRCSDAGINDHVSKPVDAARLYSVLSEQISIYRKTEPHMQ